MSLFCKKQLIYPISAYFAFFLSWFIYRKDCWH